MSFAARRVYSCTIRCGILLPAVTKGRSAMPKITPNLWFDTEAEEAADF